MPRKRADRSATGVGAGSRRARREISLRGGRPGRELEHANRELSRQLRAFRDRHRSLEEARAHYVDLFDFAPVTYALLDTVGIILQINLAGCELLQVERAHVLGHPLLAFVVAQDRRELLDHLRRCRAGAGVVESEIRFARPGDPPVTCRLYSGRGTYDGRNALPTVIVDQTERLALDEARLSAERRSAFAERDAEIARDTSAAKDRFLAVVSHELRTPLTPALFAASRLAGWETLPEHARHLATTIKRNIEFEAQVIDDLLDVARINRGRISLQPEVVDVHDVIQEAIAICQPGADLRRVRFSASLTAPEHHVHADRARLRQVFWNLLNNAVKFSNPGSCIGVRSGRGPDAIVRITVTDQGAGMDEHVLRYLFTPFDRRPPDHQSRAGLGLGLTICRGIMAAHGGQIWATSDGPGQGSTFGVELTTVPEPRSTTLEARPADATDGRPEPAPADTKPLRVLVVEDDMDSSDMLSLFLSHQGYEVEVAGSLEAGLRRLEEEWDIILSDIGLPDGSGLDIARQARQMPRPPQRLIAFTGYGAATDIRASRDAGFDDHVVKPIDLDRLLVSLRRALARRDS